MQSKFKIQTLIKLKVNRVAKNEIDRNVVMIIKLKSKLIVLKKL